MGAFHCAYPEMKPILGFARTATLRTAVPYTDPPSFLKERRLSWYEHIEGKGIPTISVVQDIDDVPGLGAFWGEVHSNVLKGLDIADGDLIHADRHGAVIIPEAALLALPSATDLVMRKERPLIGASKRAGF